MKLIVIPELSFTKREHQKASDVVNCLLNYGYGILYQRVWQALLKEGLNPQVSFLHAFQNNKPTLVYDLVEEYRQAFVDRAVFSLLTKGKKGADFGFDKEGMLNKETKGQITRAVLNRLSGVMVHKGKKIKSEEVISLQIKNLVLYLKEEANYRAFISGY
jgi:CRISPR-associated protein Cas1